MRPRFLSATNPEPTRTTFLDFPSHKPTRTIPRKRSCTLTTGSPPVMFTGLGEYLRGLGWLSDGPVIKRVSTRWPWRQRIDSSPFWAAARITAQSQELESLTDFLDKHSGQKPCFSNSSPPYSLITRPIDFITSRYPPFQIFRPPSPTCPLALTTRRRIPAPMKLEPTHRCESLSHKSAKISTTLSFTSPFSLLTSVPSFRKKAVLQHNISLTRRGPSRHFTDCSCPLQTA
mmetsp:Transcript_22800/g.52764  ORF Transcript_22800/g.52764 Transcript_22800/m.52764 type:complete len:231 (+) Transcript_22800:2385-3077(+)